MATSIFRLPKAVALAAVALLALIGGGLALRALQGSDNEQGGRPKLDAVHATATSNGVSVTVEAAAFSGTTVFLALRAQVDGTTAALVSIPAEAFAGSDLHPLVEGRIRLPVNGRASVERFHGVAKLGPYVVRISGIDIQTGGEPPKRLAGKWDIRLDGPRDLSALRTEYLEPTTDGVNDKDVRVRGVRAVRSTVETLVTLLLDGPQGIGSLAQPVLRGQGGEPIYGARVEGSDQTGSFTYAFPATPFGEPLRLGFDTFITANPPGSAGSVDVALGAAMKRHEEGEWFGKQMVIDGKSDIIRANTDQLSVTGVWFAGTKGRGHVPDLIAFTLAGAIGDDARAFHLTLPDGTVLDVTGWGSDSGIDATGAPGGSPRSYVQFQFPDFDSLRGDVRLTLGMPARILKGIWDVEFIPAKGR